ncbi:MAG: DUF5035 family protein [Bacteroides sp.]|nr:DUF5035 family protein [Bacteroides sp.]
MKKVFVLCFFFIFLFGCSTDDSDTPILKLIGVYVNDDDTNYAKYPERLPPLSVSDEVDISFSLNGNGNYLRTFVMRNENSNITTTMFFYVDDVSDELTDIENGLLAFKDIEETNVAIKAIVTSLSEEDPSLSFFLSSKAVDSQGATFKLDLVLNKEENDEK